MIAWQALSWSIYRLCCHREVQQKAREEILQVLGSSGDDKPMVNAQGWPTFEALQQMKYVEAVCMEVLLVDYRLLFFQQVLKHFIL